MTCYFIVTTFGTTFAMLPLFQQRYNSDWKVFLKLAVFFLRYGGIFCLILLYWAFCFTLVLYLDRFSKALNERGIKKTSMNILRFSAWRLERIVKDINSSFGLMILITLTATNAYVHYELQELLQHIIPHVLYGHSFEGGIKFAAWTVMDFVNVVILLYPAIQINSKVMLSNTRNRYYLIIWRVGETFETTISNNDEHMFGERLRV